MTQNQQLTQRLSPRQLLYVRLLEMTAPEVEEEVRRQLDDNPALEVSDHDDQLSIEPLSEIDEPERDEASDWSGAPSGSDLSQWQIADDTPDLMNQLIDQIDQQALPEQEREIAHYIIGNLDSNGYLTRSRQAMADDLTIDTGRDVTIDDIQSALNKVRALDPAGIGAVDLRDCLLLQLHRHKQDGRAWEIAEEIVHDYFDLFSKKHFDRLRVLLDVDDATLKDALHIILSLNPKPGAGVAGGQSADRAGQITPDVAVDEDEDGRFNIWLLSRMPQLQVARSFIPDDGSTSVSVAERDAQAFVRLKRDDAEAFIGALRQRGDTLVAVTEAIVRRQLDFFKTGDKSTLRPMILRDVASDTGMDVSMVSRATAGKYLATSMGSFPMKMFFSEAPSEESEASSHQLQQALTEIIDKEDPRHPLNDQALMEALEKRGFKIARRTVTKYRERMGIPVGRMRKKI